MPAYIRHSIPKQSKFRTGEFREVWQVCSLVEKEYKSFTRRFELFLQDVIAGFPHVAAHGYVRGRSALENAKLHTGNKFLLKADIENFFPSISKKRICKLFISIGMNADAAELLAEFVTLNSSLPLGVPSSPMLANFVCFELDTKLTDLAEKYACTYSRYADDLSFSSNEKLPPKKEIIQVLKSEDFNFSEKKYRKTKIGQSHFVTGLSVSDAERPRIPKKMKRKMRQVLYYCDKYGIADHLYQTGSPDELISMGINKIDGYVRYISHVEKESLPQLRKNWGDLMKRDKVRPSYKSYNEFKQMTAIIFADESVFNWEKKTYLALGFVSVLAPSKLKFETVNTHRKHISDPFADGDLTKLLKKGLHFVDSSEDLRKAYIDKLQSLPLNSYIAFCELPDVNQYEAKYLYLIRKLLPHRLKYFDRAELRLVFEENSRVSTEKLKEVTSELYANLKVANDRYPRIFTTDIGSKENYPEFSAPDFFLCVWNRYAKMQPKEQKRQQREQMLFERLRDKQRVIINCDNNIVFSRKRPFRSFYELKNSNLH